MSVTQHGLIVDSEMPFLAASPDGLITEPGFTKEVLEIKCPVLSLPAEDIVSL